MNRTLSFQSSPRLEAAFSPADGFGSIDLRNDTTANVARIYTSEAGKLRSYAQRFVRSRERAEDVIHDAFVQILRDAHSFDPSRGSARNWVYAIIRNTALKSAQQAKRESALPEDETADSMPCDDSARDAADRIALRVCLERLGPKRRASIILAVVDGRTHNEIAECLNVPVGTVKSWIRRELLALRRKLDCGQLD